MTCYEVVRHIVVPSTSYKYENLVDRTDSLGIFLSREVAVEVAEALTNGEIEVFENEYIESLLMGSAEFLNGKEAEVSYKIRQVPTAYYGSKSEFFRRHGFA